MAMTFDPFGLKARERIAKIERDTAAYKARRVEGLGKLKVIDRVFGRGAQASLSGLQNELYPNAEKSNGALTRTTSVLYSYSNDRLRKLSRMAIFESPTGAAMVGRLAEVVVGSGLRLRPQPFWDIIDPAGQISPEGRAAWVRNVEQRYKLWSKSYSPEYNTRRNLYQLSRAAFEYLLQDGEYFVLLRYANTARANPLSIQIIPPENITGGHATMQGGECINGIEYDSYGQAIAYWILDDKTGQETRVPRFGPRSGRVMMIHNYLSTNEKQLRGVPFLANCLQEIAKQGQYEELEIQAAIVNAIYAVWVKPPDDADGEPTIGGGRRKRQSEQSDETTPTNPDTDEYVSRFDSLDISRGGVVVDALPAGHEVQSFDTKRPNVNFGTFMHEISKNLSASKGLAVSAVELSFNQSYTGARGELLMMWMAVDRYMQNHGYDFEDDIYQMWFLGEVDRFRITAPGIYDSKDIYLAYTNAQWIGNQRPDIDPLKSVNANILEQKYAYKTGAEITAERSGGDYDSNLATIAGEFERIAEAYEPMERITQPEQSSDMNDSESGNVE